MRDIYIIGAGGFGREVFDTIQEINRIKPKFKVVGFIDEDETKYNKTICGIEVCGNLDFFNNEICQHGKTRAVIAIGSPHMKERIAKTLEERVIWETVIHPTAYISGHAVINNGCIIQCFSAINSNVILNEHCIVNCNCVIGHDTSIGNYSSLMPMCGIMGNCKISERVYIGVGAVSIQGITIGADAIVGAGSVVIRDVDTEATVVGNPAKRIK